MLILLIILIIYNVIIYCQYPQNIFFFVGLAFSVIIFSFFIYFFRNPEREADVEDESLIVAPADGHVVVIEPTEEHECFNGEKRIQVSIFMTVFNVHANWYPIAGIIKYCKHYNGRHMAAYLPKSSHENERSSVLIETPKGSKVLVRQIAGALARRIVTYSTVGEECLIDQHMGFIKFGSRVDVYLPLDAEVCVSLEQRTVGNETIIAKLKEK